ncbi:MAG: hypothetical protein IKI33_07015 [Eubacterium sp.]|nr:hypothetical protein [Eubacterium sp.]
MENNADGHRERLRKKFIDTDGEGLSRQELLEALLFYSVARRDTKPVAKEVLRVYEKDFDFLEADLNALSQIGGVGECSAELIALAGEVARRVHRADGSPFVLLDGNVLEIKTYAANLYKDEAEARLDLTLVDKGNRVLGCHTLCRGFESVEAFDGRGLIDFAANKRAQYAYITVNRTGESYYPREADLSLVKYASGLFEKEGVELKDYVIVCKKGTFALSADYRYCDYL